MCLQKQVVLFIVAVSVTGVFSKKTLSIFCAKSIYKDNMIDIALVAHLLIHTSIYISKTTGETFEKNKLLIL